MRRLFLVLAALAVGLLPKGARAWANAQVTSASADVRIEADARVHARLVLHVHVLGGWLSELEIAGLDRPLALDGADAPTFASAEGVAVPFTTTSDPNGRVAFRFGRRDAPRVGEYVATFAYDATLAEAAIAPLESGRVRYGWTFPAWAASLDAVTITLSAPESAEPIVEDDEGLVGEQVARGHVDGRAVMTFHRFHLPRSIPWSVGFTFPRSLVPSALAPPPVAPAPRAAAVVTSRDGRPQPATGLVVLAFVLVAIAKRLTFARRCRRRGAEPRPLVPIRSTPVFALLVVALGALAARIWPSRPELGFAALLGIVLLSVQRCARKVATPRLGSFVPVSPRDRRAARWDGVVDALAPAAWFDATRLVGLVVMGSILAGLAALHLREAPDSLDSMFSVPHALGLFALLGFVGTEGRVPRSVAERLTALEGVVRSLRLPVDHGRELAFRLVLHRDVHEVPQDARLRLVSEHRLRGLVRLDVALVERATLGGYVATPVLLVVVRQGSEAEHVLGRADPNGALRLAPGGRRARVLPLRASTFALVDRLIRPPVDRPTQHAPRATADRPAIAAHA